MKVTIDIDCTPDEARTFLGLPDVKPMQEQMMQELQDRMLATVRSMSPDEMMKAWLPDGMAGLEQMQQFFGRMASGKG
ncbi:MAG: DUF6489 family protein [Amaricoccus sp.]|uniref:DUF6489 family protein n=1 Tax=Amaricoccus sp. TaxID=1872485 RepID=UPI0039E6F4EC